MTQHLSNLACDGGFGCCYCSRSTAGDVICCRCGRRLKATPSDPIAASASPRPDGWLDGEIDLTAFALAHPDCDVKAVLRGFAEWILAAPKDHP